MTILRKQLFKSTFIASLTAGFTIWFGVTFEYDDYYQAALQFFSILYMSHKSLNTRKNEHEFQRKNRVAKAKFQNLLQKDPGLAEGLFADNVPLAVIRWFQKETGVDLFKVPKLEVVDSFSKVGDAPGNLIFRTGIVLGKLIGNWERSKKGSLEDYLSKGFEKFYQENKILLGEEISKGVFYKNLVFGNNRPIGIFLYHEECKCLVIEEKDESFKDSMVKISLCFKKSLFETIDENVWKEIKEGIHRAKPLFAPGAGRSR